MIFNYPRLLIQRGEGMPSPLLFLVTILLFISVSKAQFGTEKWLHPGINIFTAKDTSSLLQLYNNSHIGLINFNDSLNISKYRQGFTYIKRLGDGMVRCNYSQHRSTAEFIKQDYSFGIKNNYSEALLGYEITKGIITANVDIAKYSGIFGLSPSLFLSIQFHPLVTGTLGKSISKTPFQLSLNYTDFIYRLNNIYTDHTTYYYGITVKDDNYQIDYLMEEDNWGINSNDSSLSAIELDTGIKRNMNLNGVFNLNGDRKINWTYYERFSQTALDLNNSSNASFLTINKFEIYSHVFSLNYQFYYSKYKLNFTLLQKQADIELSNRIQPFAVSTDLESFFNSAFILLNKDIGNLEQSMISIALEPAKSSALSPSLKFDWLRERYHISLTTASLALIGIPVYFDSQDMNITGKEAINIRLGLKFSRDHWLVAASFSQHIPYKIDTLEEVPEPEEKEKEKIYGGGLFHLSLTRHLD